jgi:cadmium resistance protein CadD (predicted permease)
MFLLAQQKKFTRSEVYAGQFLGISLLILLSLSGMIFALIVPLPYIGLLGFFPIYLAIKSLFDKDDESELGEEAVVRRSFIPFVSTGTLSVASITVANGGDNVGVYIPLFTSQSTGALMFMIAVFLIMAFFWLKLSDYMSSHPVIGNTLRRFNHILFPLMLFILGIYIFIECGTHTLVFGGNRL